nr:hypothetical protein [Neisseria weixii]
MKVFFRWLLVLLLVAAAALSGWFYHERVAQEQAEVLSREGVLTQIKQLNRLESTAFYISIPSSAQKKKATGANYGRTRKAVCLSCVAKCWLESI